MKVLLCYKTVKSVEMATQKKTKNRFSRSIIIKCRLKLLQKAYGALRPLIYLFKWLLETGLR